MQHAKIIGFGFVEIAKSLVISDKITNQSVIFGHHVPAQEYMNLFFLYNYNTHIISSYYFFKFVCVQNA